MCFCGTVFADDKVVAELKILMQPTRTVYEPGETVDLYGAIVKAIYTDGTSETLDIKDLTVGGFDTQREGSQLGYLAYGEYTCPFSIEVRKGCLTSIKASVNRVNIIEGMKLSKDMFTVVGVYDVGTEKEITNYTIEYNPIKQGRNDVKISVGDLTTTVVVTARENTCESITIVNNGKDKFLIGERFEHTGLKVDGKFLDGSTRDVTTKCEVKSPTLDSEGEFHVTVKYEGKLATYKVRVYKLICENIDISHWDEDGYVLLTLKDMDEPVKVDSVVVDNNYETKLREFYISYMDQVFNYVGQIPDELMVYDYSNEVILEVPIGINYKVADRKSIMCNLEYPVKLQIKTNAVRGINGIYDAKKYVQFNIEGLTEDTYIPLDIEVLK